MEIESNPIVLQVAQYLSDTLQMELLNTGHVASEALFNSIETVVERTMSSLSFTTQGLFYAKYVNSGRKAGVKGIPLNVLTEWVRRRKIELQGKRVESVAFAMQVSIKQHGIRPARFIDKSIRKFESSKMLENKIERLMEQFLDDKLHEMFNKLAA